MKPPERNCRMCSPKMLLLEFWFAFIFFQYCPFSPCIASISHFLTVAVKCSCFSYNEIRLLCFLSIALSVSHNPLLLYFPFVDCGEPFLVIVAGSGLSFLWESCKVLLESAGIAGAIFYPCLWEVFGPTWFVHASHVCSQSLFGCSQRMNGMSRMQFDDALFNLLSLIIWSRVSWLYLKCNLNNFNRCCSHLE